jgi:hypothetical protein
MHDHYVQKEGGGGTKVLPPILWAVEHQIRQLFTSIKPPDVVGLGAFGSLVIIGEKPCFCSDFAKN